MGHDSRFHSYLSPSKVARVLSCPGSLQAAIGIEEIESEEAAEGTAAHEAAEKWLRLMLPPPGLDEAMLDALAFYVSECLSEDGLHLIEENLSLDGLVPLRGQFGTCDHILIAGNRMVVSDLKYGQGVIVQAERNPQLALYGMAAVNAFGEAHGVENVTLRIIQPRREHTSVWSLTIGELAEYVDSIRPDVGRALWENPLRIPSASACQFCPAGPTCPERALDARQAVTNALVGEDLSLQEKADLLLKKGIIEATFRDWKKQLLVAMEMGEPVAGWTITPGRKSRSWLDEDMVRRVLGPLAYNPAKLVSVAQAETHKKLFPELCSNVLEKRSAGGIAPLK